MADLVTIVETIGSTAAGVAALGAAGWRPFVKRHDLHLADDLFLHGAAGRPGLPAIVPAGERLSNLETQLVIVDGKLSTAHELLVILSHDVGSLTASIQSIEHLVHSVNATVEAVATEQTRINETPQGEQPTG